MPSPGSSSAGSQRGLHRPTVGLVALLLLGCAAVLLVLRPEEKMWIGACLRVGAVMAALWLALPKLQRFPWYFVLGAALVVGLLISLTRPRALAVLVAALFAAGSLRRLPGWLDQHAPRQE